MASFLWKGRHINSLLSEKKRYQLATQTESIRKDHRENLGLLYNHREVANLALGFCPR